MLDIAMAGAGIGGLACAAGAAQDGHRVVVYDQFDAPAPVGSGLVVQPVGMAVLDALGAGAAVRAMGAPLARLLGREARNGQPVLDVSYGTVAKGVQPGLGVHRAALFDALLDAARAVGVRIVQGHRVTGRRGQRLTFAGHPDSPRFDLIVDAAGTGSPLSPLRARPLSYGALWGWVDWPEATPLPYDHLSQVYRGASRMLGVLPVGAVPGQRGRKAAVFWSLRADGEAAWRAAGLAAWQAEAATLWPEFAAFAEQITDAAQMTMARYTHGSLWRPVADGMAHIGDAAHRASPQLGQGANMALLDAAALLAALRQARGDVPLALLHYARARRSHVHLYQVLSRMFTPQYQSDSTILPVVRDRLLYPLSQVTPLPTVLTALVCGHLLPPLGSLPELGPLR